MSIKKYYFLVKCCVLFTSVMMCLRLFKSWRIGDCVARACFADPLEEEYERQVLEDEVRVVPGLGEEGAPALLSGAGKWLGEKSFKKNGMNIYVSDRISYSRTLPDVRDTVCSRVVYDAELPSVSVVIVFHNEPYSVLLRTVWNVLNTARRDQPWYKSANRNMKIGYPGQELDSEHVYLKEVILVDDNSTLPELRGKLSHYVRTRLPRGLVRLLRLPERGGLIRARQAGARAARGDALLFLGGHCEGMQDWIRPLLQRVKDKRTAVGGGFTFAGFYTWTYMPDRERLRRKSRTSPFMSPTMTGGLFAVSRSYYWQLGGYDEQMRGWGEENLEMSFRVWQCGGSLEMIPCSQVGHVHNGSFNPEGLQEDTQGSNMARVAEVWMDEYAELFYLLRPDFKLNPLVGDVSARKALRKKLRCRSFQWFLDTVFPEKFVPVRDAMLYGRVQNPATELCLETWDNVDKQWDCTQLRINLCSALLNDGQHFSLSHAGQLRDELKCARVSYEILPPVLTPLEYPVVMVMCDSNDVMQQWEYVRASQQLRHERSGMCLDVQDVAFGSDAEVRACTNHTSMRWTFDYGGSERSNSVLAPDVEERLQSLHGKRRGS